MDEAHRYFGGSQPGEERIWADVNAWMHMQALQWEPGSGRSTWAADRSGGCGC